jgi:hypothetical protein
MKSSKKYIGLNQRIPFEVLDSAIHFYLDKGEVDKPYILQRMQEFTTGSNRAHKAATYVVQILSRQVHILDRLRNVLKGTPYNSIRAEDRKAVSLCLISLTYPITYDLLIALSQGLKVQNQINKKFISEKVKSIYGSNRTVDIAIDALLPMIIELNTITRIKTSIYSLASTLVIKNKFVAELIIYTDIKLSGSKSLLLDDLGFKPWYAYFDFSGLDFANLGQLIINKDSAVGRGYLTLKSWT